MLTTGSQGSVLAEAMDPVQLASQETMAMVPRNSVSTPITI